MLDFSHIDRVAKMDWAKDIPREFFPVFIGVASLSEKAIDERCLRDGVARFGVVPASFRR